MNKLNIRTMQDLADNLEDLGYTTSVVNQIRPRINDCERIYKQPLQRIPADYESFVERWGQGRVAALAEGFESHEKFVEWRKRVRGALSRIHLKQSGSFTDLTSWQPILDVIEANSGPKEKLGPHRIESARCLAEVAAEDGLMLHELTGPVITGIAAPLKSKRRRAFKAGIRTVNELFEHPELVLGLHNLLPMEPLPQPDQVKSPPSSRRRGGPEADPAFWREFDAFVVRKRGKDDLGRPMPAEESEFKPRTAKTYEDALNKATGVLERGGALMPGDRIGLRDLCNRKVIERVADLWQVRMLDGEVDKEASTLHLTIERLSHIAIFMEYLSKKDRKKLQKTRYKVRKKAKRRSKMSAPRERWIRAFAKSTPQQLAVHTMPETLMRQAQGILDDWDQLKRKKQHKRRMRALHLGIAACQSAVLFRGSALRAANLRKLPFRGDDAQLFLCPEGKDVSLSIPAHLVKNGVDIEADFDEDAGPVIEWYLREVRPRLIEDHPYGHDLADGDWLFPSKREDCPMEETTFAEHYRVGVEAVGLDMSLHQARHVTVYFILSEDPSALALAAAVLGDEVSTVEAHYAWIDGVKAVSEGRKLARQARKNARKHKKGKH